MKTKVLKRTIAAVIAFILIGVVLCFANSLVGNPISKMIVNSSAKKYIQQNYQEMDLQLEKAGYNFKDGTYWVNVKSNTSIDTHFSVDFLWNGKVRYDNYENRVLKKGNTLYRLEKEYRKLADTIFESEDFPYKSDIAFGSILDIIKSESEYEKFLDSLELDKIYNIREIAKENANIVLYVETEDITVTNMKDIILDVRQIFDNKNIPFYCIDLVLNTPKVEGEGIKKEYLSIENFLYSDIYQEGLEERLKTAIDDLQKYYEEQDKLYK